MSYENVPLSVNHIEHKFEVVTDNQTSFVDYKQAGHKVYLIHTEVPPALEGKGIASALVEKTLTYLAENHLQLVPLCSYVQHFLEKHPEWNKLVAEKGE